MSNDREAARIAATYGSSLTSIDQALCSLYKAVVTELETPEAEFNSVRAKRWEKADDANFLRLIGEARAECQAAGIPFTTYNPVLDEAVAVFSELRYFKTAPRTPDIDFEALASDDRPIELPFGYGIADGAYMAAHEALSTLQLRMNTTINQLLAFRSASVGATVPDACLPNPSDVPRRFVTEVERTIRRLSHDPELLFTKDWDYNDGLNAGELNRLSAALRKGRIINMTTEATRKRLTFLHPDPARTAIVWTVWAGMEYLAERMKDGVNAKDRLPKFADTLEYLRAWITTASVQNAPNSIGGTPPRKSEGEGVVSQKPPEWIYKQFRQLQQRLLVALWGKGAVAEGDLYAALGYFDTLTAQDNLLKQVTRTNDGLCTKRVALGEAWTIRRNTRNGVLHFSLEPDTN